MAVCLWAVLDPAKAPAAFVRFLPLGVAFVTDQYARHAFIFSIIIYFTNIPELKDRVLVGCEGI